MSTLNLSMSKVMIPIQVVWVPAQVLTLSPDRVSKTSRIGCVKTLNMRPEIGSRKEEPNKQDSTKYFNKKRKHLNPI